MKYTIIFPVLLLLFCQSLFGQTDYDNRLKLQIAPFVWMTSMKGDLVVKGNSHPIDYSFNDFLKYSNLGLSGHIEVKKNRWALIFEWNYIDLRKDQTYTELALGEISAAFRLSRNFEVLAGGRFYRSESEFPMQNDEISREKVSWVDPLVGGRASWDITRSFVANMRADVGGLGIGSKLQFNLNAGVGYRLANITFMVAYRIWYAKYESGSGTDRFLYDVTTSGPGMSMIIHF